MKKAVRVLALVLIIATLIGSTSAFAAEPRSNAYISYFSAAASSDGKGNVRIDFGVRGTGTMKSIGASRVEVYKADGSLVWIVTSANENYVANMLGSNTGSFYGYVLFKGTPGESYYAIVTLYASDGVGSGTEGFLTNTVVA